MQSHQLLLTKYINEKVTLYTDNYFWNKNWQDNVRIKNTLHLENNIKAGYFHVSSRIGQVVCAFIRRHFQFESTWVCSSKTLNKWKSEFLQTCLKLLQGLTEYLFLIILIASWWHCIHQILYQNELLGKFSPSGKSLTRILQKEALSLPLTRTRSMEM